MFIHGTSYPTDLHLVQSIRSCLLRHYTLDVIVLMESYINRTIECIDITYNSFNYSFTIKIRKSAMKKKSFKHTVTFYYDLMMKAMYSFYSENRELIVHMLRDEFGLDADAIYDSIIENPIQLYNLFHIYCLSNYTMQICL